LEYSDVSPKKDVFLTALNLLDIASISVWKIMFNADPLYYTLLPTSVVELTCGVTITCSMEKIPHLNQESK